MDDFVVNVKQIWQYSPETTASAGDVLLGQSGVGGVPAAGAYFSMQVTDLIAQTRMDTGPLNGIGGISFGTMSLTYSGSGLSLSGGPLNVQQLNSTGDIFVAGVALADQEWVQSLFDNILEHSVWSFNGRTGAIQLETDDILRAGAAPIWNAHFGGYCTAPTPWDFRANSTQIATTEWVQMVVQQLVCGGSVVTSVNGRGGAVVLNTDDINAAYGVVNIPGYPAAPTPPMGDASNRIATTLFVDDGLAELQSWTIDYIATGGGVDLSQYALLASPQFSGVPTAPTAIPGSSSGQIATTAFVAAAVTASTTGVSSFNTRTGAIVLTLADITGAQGAPINSPIFTGTPQAPTPPAHNSSADIATTAYVQGELAALPTAPVLSFNTRTGAIVLNTADITGAGGAPSSSPTFIGTPAAPTAAPGTNTTQIATTAFVTAAVSALGSTVTSFNSRTGAVNLQANDVSAVGGAMVNSPTFTGTPAAPTAAPGTSTTQLATTAFVANAVSGINLGVTTFNTRSGAVTLTGSDITGAGGALLASPAFSGAPTAPTPVTTSNDGTLATTAFVKNSLAAGNVSSFNSRTGAVTFQASDLSAVGGALLAGPAFTGAPTAPTATAGTNTTQLATTAFVTSAISAINLGVTTFNTRSGAVTLSGADVTGAGGALLASPTFTGTPAAPTAAVGTATTQLATTAFVAAQIAATPGAAGTKVLLMSATISSAVASVDFLYDFTQALYDEYEIHWYGCQAASQGNHACRVSTDGSTFITAATHYAVTGYSVTGTGAGTPGATGTQTQTFIPLGTMTSSTANFSIGHGRFGVPHSTKNKPFYGESIGLNTSGAGQSRVFWGGMATGVGALKGLRFYCDAGNLTLGVWELFGIVPGPNRYSGA